MVGSDRSRMVGITQPFPQNERASAPDSQDFSGCIFAARVERVDEKWLMWGNLRATRHNVASVNVVGSNPITRFRSEFLRAWNCESRPVDLEIGADASPRWCRSALLRSSSSSSNAVEPNQRLAAPDFAR
jgi:hypothetical protein